VRILAISLITAVFVATVGLGRLFDHVYMRYVQDDVAAPISSVMAIEQFGSDLQNMLNNGQHSDEQLTSLITQWPKEGNFRLSLMPTKNLVLPDNLQHDLIAGKPLTLASEDDVAIYYLLPKHQQLLVVTSNLLNQPSPTTLNRYLFTSLFYLCLLLLMLLWLYPLIKRLLALRAMTKGN
jgi:two-component system, OmpR family, sensor kinase